MVANKCHIDIEFNIGEAGMGKIRALRNPTWLVERLRLLQGVIGVGVGPSSISMRIKGLYYDVNKTIEEAIAIINEELI